MTDGSGTGKNVTLRRVVNEGAPLVWVAQSVPPSDVCTIVLSVPTDQPSEGSANDTASRLIEGGRPLVWATQSAPPSDV